MAQTTGEKKHLSPTVFYLLTGLVFSWPGLMTAVVSLSEWQTGATFSASSLTAVHTLILGFMLTVMFGVMFQVVPIAFQAPFVPRRAAFWHLPVHALSVILMITGFATFQLQWVAVGGSVLLLGTIFYFAFVFRSYRAARNKTAVHRHLFLPVLSLLTVQGIGIWMASGLSGMSEGLFLTHIFLGGFGFWVFLIMVVSYKFVPMFVLSHGYKVSLPTAVRLFFLGVIISAISNVGVVGTTSKALLVAGSLTAIVGCVKFAMDMVQIIRARKKKRIVLPLCFALCATLFVLLSTITLLTADAFHQLAFLVVPAIYALVFLGFVPLILSYVQKIIPFLWYEYRFSHHKDRKTAPLIDEMVPRLQAKWAMGLYYAGALGGFLYVSNLTKWLALGWPETLIPYAAGIFMTFGSLILFVALVHVLTIGGPRRDD